MSEVLIPYLVLSLIGVAVYLIVYLRFRSRQEMHVTVREAMEKGVELPEAVIARLGEPQRSKQGDLRRGLLGVAFAFGFLTFGLVLGEEDATRPLAAIACFPLLIGLAYLALWRFENRDA